MAPVIRIDAIQLAIDPPDMRAGFDMALARVVKMFDAAQLHHAYLFANRRANRMKVLVHDGIGIWFAARRLNQGQSNNGKSQKEASVWSNEQFRWRQPPTWDS
ncbi:MULTISPECIES: IS66 family insertion sequence element accessory protein TnpB [Burkholderia]|jgi:hypothetical protein|uniref:IS66 family insertion sequence element accessory protein TnpB n=1 Tax=Burkholderia TaxID=32008 RepID=UPI00158EADE3|nr:IS66 family insertion sequence element accessory protein TnpB [Burkholderia ambifaria]